MRHPRDVVPRGICKHPESGAWDKVLQKRKGWKIVYVYREFEFARIGPAIFLCKLAFPFDGSFTVVGISDPAPSLWRYRLYLNRRKRPVYFTRKPYIEHAKPLATLEYSTCLYSRGCVQLANYADVTERVASKSSFAAQSIFP